MHEIRDMEKNAAMKKAEPGLYGAVNTDIWGQKRIGDWIQTYTGRKFHLLDARVEDFCIEDIAHALSNICRFTGHVSQFYSVAEHSVRVANRIEELYPDPDQRPGKGAVYNAECLFGRELAFIGLMHDASEAYLTDVARPFKQLPEFKFYRDIEDKLSALIAEAFHFCYPYPTAIKTADEVLLGTEARDLMGNPTDGWHFRYDHLPERIKPWSPVVAKHEFLKAFHRLNPRTDPRWVAAAKLTGEL